ISSRPSIGHFPGLSMWIAPWTGHVHVVSSRIGTSPMPHFRHLPALSSMTSSSPAIGQTYETGGRFCCAATDCDRTAANDASKSSAERMTRIFRYLIASMRRVTLAGLIALLFAIATRAEPPGLDAAFKRFWAADDERQAAELVDSIVRSGASFDDAYRRLKEGRPYS